jgi:hypothetical protein
MQNELNQKQQQIDDLKKENMNLVKSDIKPNNKTENNHYSKFLELRIAECMDENKRYLAKYSDLRNFAYSQIENLVRRSEKQKKVGSSITNNNINVYKQLIEKERKQWQDER